ncbi:MAG: DUF4265 domain-containing protein [Rhizomicrobium sp.]
MKMEDSDSNLVKITFYVSKPDGKEVTETMWARQLHDNTYVIDNSPFDAFGVSYMDRVRVTNENGLLTFAGVVERGGHSTYRIKMRGGAGHEVFLKYWPILALLGCTYEGADTTPRLYSIDIPRQEAVKTAYAYLEDLEKKGVWYFEEAHYFHPDKSNE